MMNVNEMESRERAATVFVEKVLLGFWSSEMDILHALSGAYRLHRGIEGHAPNPGTFKCVGAYREALRRWMLVGHGGPVTLDVVLILLDARPWFTEARMLAGSIVGPAPAMIKGDVVVIRRDLPLVDVPTCADWDDLGRSTPLVALTNDDRSQPAVVLDVVSGEAYQGPNLLKFLNLVYYSVR